MTSPTFLERLARTELGQQLLAEEVAEALAHRKDLVAEIQRLEAEHMAALPALQDAEAKAAGKLEKAQVALRAVQDAHAQAVAARTHASNAHDMRVGKLQDELFQTASPMIAAFRGEMQDLFDTLRRGHFQEREPRRDVRGNVIPDDGPSPYEQLAKRMRAVQEAMRQAERLILEALTEDELAEKLEALRASTSAGNGS